MNGEEFESAPHELSPISRYYYDLQRVADKYESLLMAAERLLEDDGDYQGYELNQIAYPPLELYETNQRVAWEQFVLLPMKLVAPKLDMMLKVDELRGWYQEAVEDALAVVTGMHGEECVGGGIESRTSVCMFSEECPFVYLANTLRRPINTFEFNTFDYVIDPERARKIATMKIEVACQNHLESATFMESLIDRYELAYNRWIIG